MTSLSIYRTAATLLAFLLAFPFAQTYAATFGRVVPVGGLAADLAVDELRRVLYVANYTANRIDVVSLDSQSVETSMNVAPLPSSLSISPNGRWLVVTHFGNFEKQFTQQNSITIIDLESGLRRTFASAQPPLAVAFGFDNQAMIVTTTGFSRLDPDSGQLTTLETFKDITAKTLPTKFGNFPPNVVASSMAASADGRMIFGVAAGGNSDNLTLEFRYEVATSKLEAQVWNSTPPIGPRVVSTDKFGTFYVAGWAKHDRNGDLIAQFDSPAGILNIGSHAVDSDRGVIYSQLTRGATTTTGTPGNTGNTGTTSPAASPVLEVLDMDNLALIEKLQLAENLAGRSLLSQDGNFMYSISDSGVTIFPIGQIQRQNRVRARVEDVVFSSNFCDRRVSSRQIVIEDPGGNATPFKLSTTMAGVTLSATSGVTPATITVRVDPTPYQNLKGTSSGEITIASEEAINIPKSVRILINSKEPDQRGTMINVPGKLVDILPDPNRDRFFLLRQDANQVLVFDGTTYNRIATLKTSNTPTQMAVTFDRRYLLVGHDNAQIISVFDIETLEELAPIKMPGGHYPRSIAASAKGILAACRVAGPKHVIDKVDFETRSAVAFPTLGIFENDVDVNTVLTASPNGATILAVQANGTMLLYNANTDSFTVARKDATPLAGAYAASDFNQYVIGDRLFNSSLVPTRTFPAAGTSSGFFFVDQHGFRSNASGTLGTIERINTQAATELRTTRLTEAPLVGDKQFAFTRTIAPMPSRTAVVLLTAGGVTVLPWNYDAAVAVPRIQRVVNSADRSSGIAPGGLISLFGTNLSPVSQSTSEIPLPTALGESCLTVNGQTVPMILVSPTQINAQLPFQANGSVTITLRTPGGVSDNFNATVQPNAPSIFRSTAGGMEFPTIIRTANSDLVTVANPIRKNDKIVIYLTGLGATIPAIDAGFAAQGTNLPVAAVEPKVTLGGAELPIEFAGLAAGQVGVYQITALIPGGVPAGFEVPLAVTQGAYKTETLVRVVE